MILDIPKFYTALAEWIACLIFIMLQGKKRWQTAVIIIGLLPVLAVLQYYIGIGPVELWIPGMVVASLLMVGSIYLCCDVTLSGAGFYGAIIFMVAEFVAAFEWQMESYFISKVYYSHIIRFLWLLGFYSVLFGTFYIIEKKRMLTEFSAKITLRETANAVLIAIFAFFLSNISYVYKDTPFSTDVTTAMFYIRTLLDFVGVIILFSMQEWQKELHLKRELDIRDTILQRQLEQYTISKDNMEMLNRKYHDLKHQIIAIRTETSSEKRDIYLKEMEDEIKLYEAQSKTGNTVLDTIITGKRMNCAQNDINFTCVIDGALLRGMEVLDICSIFGNALDNAIECEEKINEKEKRMICVAVFSQNNFIIIRVENYCEEMIEMQSSLPTTTKKDKGYHGYGLKNIQAAAEKYGGAMKINQKDNWFCLKVLLPVNQVTEREFKK